MLKMVPAGDAWLAVEQAGSGMPLVFLHGFPLEHGMWLEQIAEFQRGYQVLAPDLRGFGKSGGVRELVTMEEFADDLVTILDALDITQPITLCGLSMGGYIAWQFALKYPERLARLILCDTKAQADDEPGKQRRRDVARRVLAEGPAFLAEEMPEKLYAASTLLAAPELVAATRQGIRETDPRAIAAASLGMAQRPDVTARLPEIRVPTLLVCGSEDRLTPPEEMRRVAASLPLATFSEIGGTGHMAPQENPSAFTALVRPFLAATDV